MSEQLLPHGFCVYWDGTLAGLLNNPIALGLVVPHVIIALSYCVLITGAISRIGYRLHREGVLDYVPSVHKNGVLAFGFIWTCGATHVLAIVTMVSPLYVPQILVLCLCAALSLVSGLVLWRSVGDIVRLVRHAVVTVKVADAAAEVLRDDA